MVPIHTHLFFAARQQTVMYDFWREGIPGTFQFTPSTRPVVVHLCSKGLLKGSEAEAVLGADPVEETCEAKIDFDHPTDVEWILRPESERSCRLGICGSWWWASS